MFKLPFPNNKKLPSSRIGNQKLATCYELFVWRNLDIRFSSLHQNPESAKF